MINRNIKVVDEHNIDREANIIFGFDVDGSEYVSYWIERDEDSNNVFVSKVVKNVDGTFNLANIEDEFEKESVSKIVKDLIAKAVSDESDKLVGDSVVLDGGKNVKFITVSFNKEQRLDVKKTYITTVKKEVTKVSENYYDVVVSLEEPQLVEEVREIFPVALEDEPKIEAVSEPILPIVEENTPVIEEPVVLEAVTVPETPAVSEPIVLINDEVKSEEPVKDDFVAFGVEAPATEATTIVSEPVVEEIQEKVEEVKTEEVPMFEAPVVEKHEEPVVAVQSEPVVDVPEVKAITPEPIQPMPAAAIIPEPTVVQPEPTVVEPAPQSVETKPLVFNASKETNLNAALGEVAKDTTIPVENIEVVREFGEESPMVSQTVPAPAQPSISPMVQPEVSLEPKTLTKKAGFANSKFFMVVAIAFFLASCVFLGYEVFNYFQLTK